MIRTTLGAVLAMMLVGCGESSAPAGTDPNATDAGGAHYVDTNGAPLPQWEFIWGQLHDYFGASTPDRITVEYWSGSTNQFSPSNEKIRLNPAGDTAKTVAHESTHLCMFNLTQGASDTNAFRFFDEGFAEITGDSIAGEGDWYKAYALAVAASESQVGKVSFAQVQDWASYYGSSGSDVNTRNWKAYQVGSSFDYMMQDVHGAAALRAFFVDIGTTLDLGVTFQNVLAKTPDEVEQEWHAYLNDVPTDTSAPSVTTMSPPDMATEVPLDTAEISVSFSLVMGPNVCLTTPCGDTGVCYTSAYWRQGNELVIPVQGQLKPSYAYDLVVGGDTGCLTSYAGTALPITHWRFTAASQ